MPYIPFLARLNIAEYIALVGSFILVGLEAIIRILTLALPSSVIKLCYRASRGLFNFLTSSGAKKAEAKKSNISTSIRNASDFVDLCALFGYYAEEHIVRTEDGYLLGVHRLAWNKGEEGLEINQGHKSLRKSVVYMHHGLLMNSEVWVCLTDEQRCLPFKLVEQGYDVWLGNNRGNKYSKKNVKISPHEIQFWDFSMDEFAFYDIPNTIQYILGTTSAPSLSYIGFSQGTAQAFATLAVHPKLNDQVNLFIALAPAMSPAGLSNGVVDALVKSSPQVLYLLFGRRSILSSATMWQSILYPPLFCRLIDMSLSFLFGWHAHNIPVSQKLAAYHHLYSFTSTKSVVHWFQIIRTKSFQMYDDVQPVMGLGGVNKYTKVAKFPTRNIKTPIILLYGGSDSLVDIEVMLKELPGHTVATEIPHYEHLDFLWAREIDTLVFPHIFDALESFSDGQHSKIEYERYQSVRKASILGGITRRNMLNLTSDDESRPDTKGSDIEIAQPASKPSAAALTKCTGVHSNNYTRNRPRVLTGQAEISSIKNATSVRHAKAINADELSPTTLCKGNRTGSDGSNLNFGDKGVSGIKLGAGKAVSGVSKNIETKVKLTGSSDDGVRTIGRKRSKR